MCCSPACVWCFTFRSPAHISWKGNASPDRVVIRIQFLITCRNWDVNSWMLSHSSLINYAACLTRSQTTEVLGKDSKRRRQASGFLCIYPFNSWSLICTRVNGKFIAASVWGRWRYFFFLLKVYLQDFGLCLNMQIRWPILIYCAFCSSVPLCLMIYFALI